MSVTGPKPQTQRFEFEVDNDGKFTYTPPGNWSYNRNDTIEFSTTSGPFTIEFEPVYAPAKYGFDPFHGPLEGVGPAGGPWVAKTTINDGLSDAHRDAVWLANKPEAGEGFVAKYRYVIYGEAETGGKKFYADDKNGIFGC